MSLIITEYAREHGNQNDLSVVAASPGFAAFLKQLDTSLDRDDTGGSSALEKAYQANPNGRDFITAYESAGLEAVAANPKLALIYPSPTANADQGAAALISSWVTPAQRDTSQAFLKFLASDAAQSDGVQYGFRPAGSNGADTLNQALTDDQKSQFQTSYTSVELPPYDALNEAASQWHLERP
jgi:ABC-type sulfate transport system substrate-binding protein